MDAVEAYARDVVEGRVLAGKYHRLACRRHLADLQRADSPGFPYVFQWPHAEKFLRFARLMRHYKGRQFAGKTFDPTPCQVFRLGAIFGWRHAETGLRRFTTSYNEVPRKQGKSFEAAVVAVYVTFFEGESGAEGYCIATKEKQAKIVFDAAKRLVKSSGLGSRIKVNAANLHREVTAQKLEPLGSDSETTDGLNPHFVGVDELHAFKVRSLLDVMESATGARLNPLLFQITTAGNDPVSPGGDQHQYACQILDGVLEDDPSTLSFFAFIAHADEGDDWLDERTWQKANPHWGISVNPEDMRKLAAKAKHMPAAASEFKQKRLNLWVNALSPSLSMDGWRRAQSKVSREEFATSLVGEPCYVGVDLSSKIDLTAVSAVFPPTDKRPKWCAIQYIWTPAATLEERAHRDRAPYQIWVDQGWLRTSPGSDIDEDLVRAAIRECADRFAVELVLVDPWKASQLKRELIRQNGFDERQILDMPQTTGGRGQGDGILKAQVVNANLDVCGCPVTSWSASNVVEDVDRNGGIFFTKNPKKTRGRIDPITAISNSMAGWQRAEEPSHEPTFFVLGGNR